MTKAIGSNGRNCAIVIFTKGKSTKASNKNRADVNNKGSMSVTIAFIATMLTPQIAVTKIAPKAGFPNQSICLKLVSLLAIANIA